MLRAKQLAFAIGPVSLDITFLVDRAHVVGSVKFMMTQAANLAVVEPEVVLFDYCKSVLYLKLPYGWQTADSVKSVTAVASEIGIQVVDKLREEGHIRQGQDLKLRIDFQRKS